MRRFIYGLIFTLSVFIVSAAAQNQRPENARALFDAGRAAASKGDFETARENFRNALAHAESDRADRNFRARIHFNIGVCFYRTARAANAVDQFEKAILFDPNYEKAFYALGMAQVAIENFNKAEQAFRGALRLNERGGETWFDLGFVYLARKNFERARGAFENAIRYKSAAAADARNNLGVLLAASGDFDAAEKQFQLAAAAKSFEAAANLRFCRLYRTDRKNTFELLAKLEFTAQNGRNN